MCAACHPHLSHTYLPTTNWLKGPLKTFKMYGRDLRSLKTMIIDGSIPMDADLFLSKLVQKGLITEVQEIELNAKRTRRAKIDGAFNILFKRDPLPTCITLQEILKEIHGDGIQHQIQRGRSSSLREFQSEREMTTEVKALTIAKQAMKNHDHYTGYKQRTAVGENSSIKGNGELAAMIATALSSHTGKPWNCIVSDGKGSSYFAEKSHGVVHDFQLDDKCVTLWRC
ncbi:unnamed protein product [Darwinula stevensoni]|uniref:Uncharacterized protein n=1 Tax=Darwinula stevensoni TaxID=69355 RepID=A0A7R8XAS1_9CRUS|nr:unnamed protein product [Darwinula stevensoni]CAG0890543.1 unnamed protein product [Darwinula stevensoni]